MNETWVVNASPIIALAKVDLLHLLKDLCREVLVPEAVVAEIVAGPFSDPARQALEHGWGVIVAPLSITSSLLEWGLGPGETAVLAVALERTSTAVLDDEAARACARAHRIGIIGTLGTIVRAKGKSLIPSAAEVLQSLRRAGLYLDDGLMHSVLKGIGETWQ